MADDKSDDWWKGYNEGCDDRVANQRDSALNYACKSGITFYTPADVLACARHFEAYLKGEEKTSQPAGGNTQP